jgi:hypothetical protein
MFGKNVLVMNTCKRQCNIWKGKIVPRIKLQIINFVPCYIFTMIIFTKSVCML